jgi:CDP-diacylglycerol pyrophosphatase
VTARPAAALLLLLVVASGCSAVRTATTPRDVLWKIVSTCLDPAAPGYCERCVAPQASTCPVADRSCRKTTEVWALTDEFVAIRDIKMCDCPEGFVHGLAMPRAPVTGVEDERRPAGIWRFAWDVAHQMIADEMEIALLVNPPPPQRSQDHLHVHLVRLRPTARATLDQRPSVLVHTLDQVWDAAARAAGPDRGRHGVLVWWAGPDGYKVTTSATSLEDALTEAECARRR